MCGLDVVALSYHLCARILATALPWMKPQFWCFFRAKDAQLAILKSAAKLLISLGANLRAFSEWTLFSLGKLPDFGSAIPRFEILAPQPGRTGVRSGHLGYGLFRRHRTQIRPFVVDHRPAILKLARALAPSDPHGIKWQLSGAIAAVAMSKFSELVSTPETGLAKRRLDRAFVARLELKVPNKALWVLLASVQHRAVFNGCIFNSDGPSLIRTPRPRCRQSSCPLLALSADRVPADPSPIVPV